MADINIRIGADLSALSKSLKQAERQLMRTGRKLKEQGQSMTEAITVPFLGLGAAALKSFADLEKFENGLASMMGSAEAAKNEMEKLREIAKAPGLDLSQAVKGSVRLQSVGIQAGQARKVLSQVGNAIALVGGSSDDLDGVTLALQQIGSKGKVSAEEINQINERMPQIRKAMQDAFGTAATEDIQKMGLSAEDFIAGITVELEKLPRATGGMSNAFNNARQATVQALAGIGKSLEENFNVTDKINAFSDKINELSQAFQNLSPELQKKIILFGGVAASIGPALMLIGQFKIITGGMFAMMNSGLMVFKPLIVAMKSMQITQLSLNAAMLANPIGVVVVAVAALAAILAVLYQRNEEVRKILNQLFENLKAVFNFIFEVGKVTLDIFVSIGKTAFRTAKTIFEAFVAVGKTIVSVAKRIPILGRAINFIQTAFAVVYRVISKMFNNLPRFFAGLTAEAKNMGTKLKAYFERIGITAEILAKKIQRGVTIDSDARKKLSESIAKLESKKTELKEVGTKFGVAFREAFNKEISTGVDATIKTEKVAEPTQTDDISSGSFSVPNLGTTEIQAATEAVNNHKMAVLDLSNAQTLQGKAIASSIEPLEAVGMKMDAVKEKIGTFKSQTAAMREQLAEFNRGLTDIVNNGMNSIAVGIGEMAGQMAAGTMTVADAGRQLVSMLAGILGEVGQLAIKTGIATIGIKAALESLNPALAIAGGIALVALSKFVQSKMASVTPLAEGGILTGPMISAGGGFLAGEAGAEAVIPLTKLDSMLSSARGTAQNTMLEVTGRISGNDLVLIHQRQHRVNNRIR